jgi:hypothetical protein
MHHPLDNLVDACGQAQLHKDTESWVSMLDWLDETLQSFGTPENTLRNCAG